MSYHSIHFEDAGSVAVITLAEPATMNSASPAMVGELIDALDSAQEHARAILLTGEGRGFCAGANLGPDLDAERECYDAGALIETHFNPLIRQIRDLRIPIVTAVNGAAAGAGVALALAGDIIIAAESAYFLEAFQRIGLVPDVGSAYILVHAAGRARAMEMMLLGERISAVQALEWGLINRVVADEQLQSEAMELAKRLAIGPTAALAMTRELGWLACETTFDKMLEAERVLQQRAGVTDDHREGLRGFREKRAPSFLGR